MAPGKTILALACKTMWPKDPGEKPWKWLVVKKMQAQGKAVWEIIAFWNSIILDLRNWKLKEAQKGKKSHVIT